MDNWKLSKSFKGTNMVAILKNDIGQNEMHITNKYFNNKDLNPSARISFFSTSMSGKTWVFS